MMIAIVPSCSVTGSFCPIRVSTDMLLRSDWPRSPDNDALDPIDVLHRDRFIEMVLLADLLDDSGIAFLAGHDKRGIARQQMLQRENQDRHEKQRRDQLHQAPGEEAQHGAPSNAVRVISASARSNGTMPSGIGLKPSSLVECANRYLR